MSNLIKATTIAEKSFLLAQMSAAVDQQLGQQSFKVKGFDIEIKRMGQISLAAVAKSILVQIPLDIQIRKPEGIFTLEASGAAMLDVRMDVDISQDFVLHTDTTLQDYTWLREPNVKLGVLNIPVETILDLILRKKEAEITQELDEVIAKHFDLRSLIAQQVKWLNEGIAIHDGLLLTGQIQTVQLSHIKEENQKIYIHIMPSADVVVKAAQLHQPTDLPTMPALLWTYDMLPQNDHQQSIQLELSYPFLAQQLYAAMHDQVIGGQHLKVARIDIQQNKQLQIDIDITSPAEATVQVTGTPQFRAGSIDIDQLDIKVKTSNLLYKLTTPILNRVIEGRMKDLLPVPLEKKINEIWLDQRSKLPTLPYIQYTIDIEKIEVDHINFLADKAVARLVIQKPDIELMVSGSTNKPTA